MDGKRMIFHVPHDGGVFPPELMDSVCVERERFLCYHREMRDYGARYFLPRVPFARSIAFAVSRLLCDVERFIDGSEIMERYGMGFCYEKAYDGTRIKTVTDGLKAATRVYYDAHHKRLDDAVTGFCGKVTLFDLHSFSERIIVKDTLKRERELPDICIGYDGYLPRAYLKGYIRCFESRGFSVALNYPYAGALVPNAVLAGRTRAEVISCMFEVNKRVYLRPDWVIDGQATGRIRQAIGEAATLCQEG